MTKRKLSSAQIAKKLGVSASTARGWAKRFDVPRKQVKGNSVYTEEAFEALRMVKKMRSNGNGYNTIQRIMNTNKAPQNSVLSEEKNTQNSQIKTTIQEAITGTLEKNNELAEKYARATFEMGSLQEKVKQLEAQTKLLPSPVDWALKQKETSDLQEQVKKQNKRLNESEQLLKSTQSENRRFKNKGFFARLFNLK